MKRICSWISLGALMVSTLAVSGQTSLNIVGYVSSIFRPGNTWFGNPLDYGTNLLRLVIPTAPEGTTVSLWSSTLNAYTPTATYSSGMWNGNLMLNPGTGALLTTPSLFTNTFVGQVLDFNGALFDGLNFHEPSPFAGPNGLYLFSSKAPVALSGHVFNPASGQFSVFEAIIGRAPHNGEQVTTLDALTQTYFTTTFLSGAWNNGDPTLALGQAAMFNIGPVPEPSALALLAAGLGALALARRRGQS